MLRVHVCQHATRNTFLAAVHLTATSVANNIVFFKKKIHFFFFIIIIFFYLLSSSKWSLVENYLVVSRVQYALAPLDRSILNV